MHFNQYMHIAVQNTHIYIYIYWKSVTEATYAQACNTFATNSSDDGARHWNINPFFGNIPARWGKNSKHY